MDVLGMFLVKDCSKEREQRIRQLAKEDPPLSALLAVVHFEWTLRRSVVALGTSPNLDVKAQLRQCHGHERYKEIRQKEVFPKVDKRLTEVIKDWNGLLRAFRLRHRIVHRTSGCGAAYATKRVEWAIQACQDVRGICSLYDVDLDARLPIRRRPRNQAIS